ncbi:MAG TPA: coproporphyrinogen dehydrogenase HemZ [Candidatus Scatomorpha gallistercoris]|nr:coproporphyrinogen dehydrogenase HemZ [Candidatus Scatomorpha gallistercoris]
MKLYLHGTDNKYAAEQTLLTLFPTERPEYPEGAPEGERCELSVTRGAKYAVCTAKLVRGGAVYHGIARAENAKMRDKDGEAHYLNRIIKLAFYRAALNSGVRQPVWGCLTGVRPAKLMTGYLREGMSPSAARGRFMREYFVQPERAQLCLDAALYSERESALLEERDVCLYVGIPFCPTRCAYCSFVSQSVEKSMKLVPQFLDALWQDIAATGEAVRKAGLRPVALYMGGGTPTTLSAQQLDELCTRLEDNFDLTHLREYTVEAGRPDTITRDKLEALKKHGVRRVSVNPQTMSDGVLEAIGRKHTAQDIVDALGLVREVGGFDVNMDLIAGLPTDSPEGFADTLTRVLSLAPENVTVHTLSLKRGSTLTVTGGALPEAEDVAAMLSDALSRLPGAGYEPYYLYRQKYMAGGFENVGWTKPGHESPYNVCIMEELCSIISMGAGGSTKLVAPGKIKRFFAPKYPLEYINGAGAICAVKERITDFYGV